MMRILQLIIVFLVDIVCMNIALNTWDGDGVSWWRSTSDFVPIYNRSYGTLQLRDALYMEFDIIFHGPIPPESVGYTNIFRVGFPSDAPNCDWHNSRYPSLWMDPGENKWHFSISETSKCSKQWEDHPVAIIDSIYHIIIHYNNSHIFISLNDSIYIDRFREETLSHLINRTMYVWIATDHYKETGVYIANVTMSNIVIISYWYNTGFIPFPPINCISFGNDCNGLPIDTLPGICCVINTPLGSNPNNNGQCDICSCTGNIQSDIFCECFEVNKCPKRCDRNKCIGLITSEPSNNPTNIPTNDPIYDLTDDPTNNPTTTPTVETIKPTLNPITDPTKHPTNIPADAPSIDFPVKCMDECDTFSVLLINMNMEHDDDDDRICLEYMVNRLFSDGDCYKSIQHITLGLCEEDVIGAKCNNNNLHRLIDSIYSNDFPYIRAFGASKGIKIDFGRRVNEEISFKLCLKNVFKDNMYSHIVGFKVAKKKYFCSDSYLYGLPCIDYDKFINQEKQSKSRYYKYGRHESMIGNEESDTTKISQVLSSGFWTSIKGIIIILGIVVILIIVIYGIFIIYGCQCIAKSKQKNTLKYNKVHSTDCNMEETKENKKIEETENID